MPDDEIIVSIKDLVKRYRKSDRNALNGISFKIHKGDFFGLLGPNGSGKTTLISILCGLLKATKGKVTLMGNDVNRHLHKVLPDIGFVPQDIALYPTLTLRQNFQLFGNLYGMYGSRLKRRIDECTEIAQLTQFVDKPIQTYSGGMKRRANLAVGLLHEPKLLFLDEATANVDPQSRNMIYESLNKLIEHGITIIYTTHYMEEAQNLCNQLVILDDGELVADGTPEELIKSVPGCKDLGELFLRLTGKTLRDTE